MNMTQEEQLDFILRKISENKGELDIISIVPLLNVSNEYFLQLLNKLSRKDQYVRGDYNSLTLEGIKFWNNGEGGYVENEKKIKALKEKEDLKDELQYHKINLEIDSMRSQIEANNDAIVKTKYDKTLAIIGIILAIASLIVAILK